MYFDPSLDRALLVQLLLKEGKINRTEQNWEDYSRRSMEYHKRTGTRSRDNVTPSDDLLEVRFGQEKAEISAKVV
jgi:hypothetical protein